MGMQVSERTLSSPEGERTAIVVTPDTHVRVGAERLKTLRAQKHLALKHAGAEKPGSDIDRAILEQVRSHPAEDSVVVFRGKALDDSGSWGFDPELGVADRLELGYLLVADELPTYRRLVAAGVFALVHVDWGHDEVEAYRNGTQRLLDELEQGSVPEVQGDPKRVAVQRADRWILSNLTHFYEDGFEEVVRSVLLAHLAKFEERIPHFRAMISELPAAAID